MRTMLSRFLSATILMHALSGVARAHGLHAEVAPRFHAMVHVLQFAGVVALAVGMGLWAARRSRDRKHKS